MAYTTIDKATDFFTNKRFTGNGSTGQTLVTGTFPPDFCWIKKIEDGGSGEFCNFDTVRGATKVIQFSTNEYQQTITNTLTAFTSTGYTLGSYSAVNGTGDAFQSMNWKAGGASSANTDGSIATVTSVNNTAGFAVTSYTGTGSNATIGTGLTSKPAWVIIKNLTDNSTEYMVGHKGIATNAFAANKYMHINTNSSVATNSSSWNSTEPTSNGVIYLGNGSYLNGSGKNYICYSWSEKPGYSSFGEYVGNGSATNGTFIYTGFAPKWVICKTLGLDNWMLYTDNISGATAPTGSNLSGIFNRHNLFLETNSGGDTQSAGTNQGMDMLSNGFKLFEDNGNLNGSGTSYIYMAFGQSIVGSNNVPATAR